METPRNEKIMLSIIEGTEYTDPAQSRNEELLLKIKKIIESGDNNGEVINELRKLIDLKQDAEPGKQLSEENFTAEDKAKLDGIDLSEYVKFTDYATDIIKGVVSVNSSYGTGTTNGVLFVANATDEQVLNEDNTRRPVRPSQISLFMANYGISSKTTIPEMQDRITALEQAISSIIPASVLEKNLQELTKARNKLAETLEADYVDDTESEMNQNDERTNHLEQTD